MDSKTRHTFEDVCEKAFVRHIVGDPDRVQINRLLAMGKPIPDHLLPGRFIMALSSERRQYLSKLTSDDTMSYRPNFWASCT